MSLKRETRLQIMLDERELALVDDWRFSRRMPSRAAAIRQLISMGLQAESYQPHEADKRSQDFNVTGTAAERPQADGARPPAAPGGSRPAVRDGKAR